MRNLKKYLAVLVVFAMMFTIIAPAGAAVASFNYEEEAQKLNALGLYKGESEDEFVPALEKALDRQTGAIMVLRLFGLEEEALYMSDEEASKILEIFTDSKDIASWAKKQVAYAVENGMIVGYNDSVTGKLVFKPLLPLNGKAYTSMILNQLGYVGNEDFTYDEATFVMAEIGGLSEDQADEFTTKAIIRDDLVGMTYGILKAVYKDEETTVIGRLIENEILTEEDVVAVDEELLPAVEEPTEEPVDVAVYSATATNGTLNVVLNEAPETAPVTADFTVTKSVNGAEAASVTASVYEYKADTKTVVLNVPVVVATTGKQTIVYSVAYKSTAAVSAPAVVVVGDATVESVSATNLKQVNVKFSAPVDKSSAETASNYSGVDVDTAVLGADGMSVQLNLKEAKVLSNDTDCTVTVKNIQNVDRTKTIADTETKFRVNDITIPTVKNVKVLGNKGLLVEFSEPVEKAAVQATDANGAIAFTFVNETVKVGTPVLDVNTDNKTFTKATIPLDTVLTAGNHTFRVNGSGTIKDFKGYAVPAQDFTLNVVLDINSPQVTDIVALSRTEAKVTFSKPVKGFDKARVSWNTNGSSTVGTLSNEEVVKINDSQYTVKFTGANALPVGVSYVVISTDSGLTDYSSNPMAANFVKQVTVAQDPAPTVTSISATDDKTIVINFNKTMESSSLTTIANYTIKDSNNLTKNISSIDTPDNNKNKATLRFSEPLDAGTYTVIVSSVKDGINVAMSTFTGTVSPTDTTAPTISNVWYREDVQVDLATTPTLKDVVVIKFSEAMTTSSLTNLSNYKLSSNGSITGTNGDLPSGTTITAISDRVVRITMPTGSISTSHVLYLGRVDGTTFKGVSDLAGNSLNSKQYNVTLTAGTVNNAPLPVLTVVAGDVLDAKDDFTVKVTSNSSLEITKRSTSSKLFAIDSINASDFEVKVGSDVKTISNATLQEVSTTKTGLKDKIVLTFGSDSFKAIDTVSVVLKSSTSTLDIYGGIIKNNADYVATNDQTMLSDNSIAPSLKTASLNSPTEVVVTFDGKASQTITGETVEQGLANDLIISQTKTVNGTATTTELNGTTKLTVAKTGANDGSQFKITFSTSLDTELPVTIKTKSADYIVTGSGASSLLVANTTGIVFNNSSSALAATNVSMMTGVGDDVYFTKGVADNVYTKEGNTTKADAIAITFNRAISLDSIVSGWTVGSEVQTITGASVSANGVFTIPNVGSFQTVGLAETYTSASISSITMKAKYDAGTKTLYLTMASDTQYGNDLIKFTTVEFTPYSSIKSSSGASIDTAYKPSCVADKTNVD